jgi:hypothetical protein
MLDLHRSAALRDYNSKPRANYLSFWSPINPPVALYSSSTISIISNFYRELPAAVNIYIAHSLHHTVSLNLLQSLVLA